MFTHVHQRLGGAVVAVVVVSTVGTAGTASAVYPGVVEWYAQAEEHFVNSTKFMQAVVDAIQAKDIGALRTACSALHDEQTVSLQAHLPTPDPALSTALQAEINDFHTAAHICMSLGPNSTSADLEQADLFTQQAIDDLRTVNDILVDDLS